MWIQEKLRSKIQIPNPSSWVPCSLVVPGATTPRTSARQEPPPPLALPCCRANDYLSAQPMFCFERALKLLLWADHVYEVGEEGGEPCTRNTQQLLALYGLRETLLLQDEGSDVKAMLAWDSGSGTVLVSFRGTASAKNFVLDLKAHQVGVAWGWVRGWTPKHTRCGWGEVGGLDLKAHGVCALFCAWLDAGPEQVGGPRACMICDTLYCNKGRCMTHWHWAA